MLACLISLVVGIKIVEPIKLPCGGTAHFDLSSGISYRCECGAVVGSIGMPRACKEELEKERMLRILAEGKS